VHRIVFAVGLAALLCTPGQVPAQESSSSSSSSSSINPSTNGASAPAATPSAPPPSTEGAAPASSQVAAAESAIARSDWKTAQAKLDAWLVDHPVDARALFDAGFVADAQNRLDAAESLYQRAIAADPKSFEAHVSLGLLLAREGKLEQARPELAEATTLDAGETGPGAMAHAWRALARIDRNSNPAEASNDLLQALKLSPQTTDDELLAADLAEKTGQLDAAEAEYRRVLGADPKSEPANAGLAHLLIQQKTYPEAETLLRTALQALPDDPGLNAQLALVLAAQDKAEALPLLEKLHTAHPQDTAIMRMLAQVRAEAGDFAGSDQIYLQLLAAAPSDPDLLIGHGQDLVREMKFADAYAVFEKASQSAPRDAAAWSGLAFTASRTSRPEVTLHALTMRSQLEPESASTYFLWATAYDALHRNKEAAAYYHHFLDAAAGKYPNQEWQARQRLQLLKK
jgi:tetratricopeptide (TPR) repeat protein